MPTQRELSQEELDHLSSQGVDVSNLRGVPVTVESPEEVAARQPKTSALAAGARAGLAGALPALAGGFAGGAATGALEGLGAGPFGAAAGGIIGGIGGAITAGMAQNALMPDTWKQKMAQDQQDHPWATTAGSLSTMALGGFRPSTDILKAARAPISKLTLGEVSAAEKEALKNVSLGAGIGAGTGVASELLTGNEITPGSVAEAAGTGALFNRPWALGHAMGFAPHVGEPTAADFTALLNKNRKNVVNNEQEKKAPIAPALSPEEAAKRKREIELAYEENKMLDMVEAQKRSEAADKAVDVAKTAQDLQAGTLQPEIGQMQPNAPFGKKQGSTRIPFKQQAVRPPESAEDFQQRLEEWKAAGSIPEERPRYETAEEAAVPEPKLETPTQDVDTFLGSKSRVEMAELLHDLHAENTLTPQLYKYISEKFLKPKGWDVSIAKDLKALGEFSPSKQTIKARGTVAYDEKGNPITEGGAPAALDTLPHEGAHGLWDRLTADQKALYARLAAPDIAKQNEARAKQNAINEEKNKTLPPNKQLPIYDLYEPASFMDRKTGELVHDPLAGIEEHFASESGRRIVNRILTENPTWGRWWKDIKAGAKVKYGKEPSLNDFYRQQAAILTSGGGKGIGTVNVQGGTVERQMSEAEGRIPLREMTAEQRREYYRNVPSAYKSQKSPEMLAILEEQRKRDLARQQVQNPGVEMSPARREQILNEVSELHNAVESAASKSIKAKLNSRIKLLESQLGTQPLSQEQIELPEFRQSGAHPAARDLTARQLNEQVSPEKSEVPTRTPFTSPITSDAVVVDPETGEKTLQKNVIKTTAGEIVPDENAIIEKAVRSRYGKLMGGNLGNPGTLASERVKAAGRTPAPTQARIPANSLVAPKIMFGDEIADAIAYAKGEMAKRGLLPGETREQAIFNTAANLAHEHFNMVSQSEKGGVGKAAKTAEEKAADLIFSDPESTAAQKAKAEAIIKAGRERRGAVSKISTETQLGDEGDKRLGDILPAAKKPAPGEVANTETGVAEEATEGQEAAKPQGESELTTTPLELIERIEGTPMKDTAKGKRVIAYLESLQENEPIDAFEVMEKFGLVKRQQTKEEAALMHDMHSMSLGDKLVREMSEWRIHQPRISHSPEGMKKAGASSGAEGVYVGEEGKGYTSRMNDNDTATHEAVHSFFDDHRLVMDSLVKNSGVTSAELTQMANVLELRGYPHHSRNLIKLADKATKTGYGKNESIPKEYLTDEWSHAIGKATEEYLAQVTDSKIKNLAHSTGINRIMGDKFLEAFDNVFHGEGAGRAKSVKGKAEYYQTEEEGALPEGKYTSSLASGRLLEDRARFANNPNAKFMSKQSFIARMKKNVPDDEMKALNDAGFDKWLASKHETINLDEAQQWIKDNGTAIDKHAYGLTNVSEAQREYDRLHHEWFDHLHHDMFNRFTEVSNIQPNATKNVDEFLKKLQERKSWQGKSKDLQQARKFLEAYNASRSDDDLPKAKSIYTKISAFPTEQGMPGWTTSKLPENLQRVDLVLRGDKPIFIKNAGHEHFNNTIGWVTLQYKTGPNGEKIAMVGEAQSDPAQRIQRAAKDIDNYIIVKTEYGYVITPKKGVEDYSNIGSYGAFKTKERAISTLNRVFKGAHTVVEHPVLNHYNRLLVKAAIEQARKEGATHIAIADAETVMMSEHHDRRLETIHPDGRDSDGELIGKELENTPASGDTIQNFTDRMSDKYGVNFYGDQHSIKDGYQYFVGSKQDPATRETNEYFLFKVRAVLKIKQEGGMRTNYDTVLPNIAENLTGSKGQRMSLGEHKNAYTDSQYVAPKLRNNLVFKNPDGTLKTDVTARVYPLDKVSARLEQEPFTTYGKYQTPEEGALPENTFSKEDKKFTLARALFTEAQLDKARRLSGANGKPVADAIQAFFPLREQYFGKYAAKPLEILDKMSMVDRKSVANVMYREDLDGKSYRDKLPEGVQRVAYDAIREALNLKQNDLIASGRTIRVMNSEGKIEKRNPILNPTYMPSIPRSEVVEALVEKTGDYKRYQKLLTDHWIKGGDSPAAAQAKLKAFSTIGDIKYNNRARFAAMRLAEGMGLPAELRITDPAKMLQRYFQRVALDKAWTEAVESNKEVMKALDLKNENNVYHPFEKIIDEVQGQPFDKEDNTIKGLNRVFTSAMLGPLTNVHIALSTLFNPMQFVKGTEIGPVYTSALTKLSQARQDTLRNGYKTGDYNTIKDITDADNTFVQKLSAISSLVGKVNGRQWTDSASRTMAQALANEIVPLRLASARRGDSYSQNLVKQLDPYWTADKKYTPDQISKLASTLGGLIHGAHDSRTLPGWMIKDSAIKPFFSLMSWSVAQTNQWSKHVWEPAMKGNLEPLLMSTLGAVIGGYAIQQLRQAITDKKTAIPSVTEIANSSRGLEGNIPLLAYNFMQMASFTGYAGIGTALGKDIFDLGYKNIPQGSTFPLDEAVTNLSKTAVHGVGAWIQNPTVKNFFDIMPQMMLDIVKDNYQTGRIALNWASEAGVAPQKEVHQFKTSKQTSNLRRWKMAEGVPYTEQMVGESNPYYNLQAARYKETQNIREAVPQIPALIARAREIAKGNPEVFRQQLQSIKQNSYQTMPSPESMPLSFARYYRYLIATQGQEAAQRVMQDYMRQNALNKAKSAMIPKI